LNSGPLLFSAFWADAKSPPALERIGGLFKILLILAALL
jgi:hypothetical protein